MSADRVVLSVGGTEPVVGSLPVSLLFRVFNEEVAAAKHSACLKELLIVCECERRGCVKRFRIGRDVYEQVRASPIRFIVAPGHGASGEMRMVEEEEHFTIVELDGLGAASAIRFDPRREADSEPTMH